VYSVLLGAIFAVAFAKEIYNLVTSKRHGKRVRSRIATKLLTMSRSSQIIRSLNAHVGMAGMHSYVPGGLPQFAKQSHCT